MEDLPKARKRPLRPDLQGQSVPLAQVCPHSPPWMRYYQWGLQIKKGAGQGEPGPELIGRSDISARSRDRQMARKTSREGVSQDLGPEGHPPRPPPVPLPRTRNLRLCDSRCRWDRGKTNSVSGCKMSSKNFCRSRRRSCWRSRAARGFGSMLAPGRTSTALKLRGDPMGAWAWGAQPEAGIPAGGPRLLPGHF